MPAEATPAHRLHVWPWLRRFGALMLRDWLAITIGRHVLSWRRLEPGELAHELAHVQQWQRHGPLFGVLYLLAGLAAKRAGGHWYRDNRYEVEARRASAEAP
jgi:hypothetical protein